jgi:hypothetical protein
MIRSTVISRRTPRAPASVYSLLAVALTLSCAGAALAAPTLGFVETWPSGPRGWTGGNGQITFTNPGTGGFDSNDGYLRMSRTTLGNFGTRSSGPEYVGDWTAAGIDKVTVELQDFLGTSTLEIHLAIGQFTNLWEYDVGFVPPLLEWGRYTIDLGDSLSFTNIIGPLGGGSFQFALENVEVVHIRSDLAPFEQVPDATTGTMGIDHLALLNSTTGVAPSGPWTVQPLQLAPPSPNPSRGPVALTIRSAETSEQHLQILDAQGRAIRSERLAGVAGMRVWIWDGRDDAGRRVPAGVYRARAWSRAGGMSRSLVRVE